MGGQPERVVAGAQVGPAAAAPRALAARDARAAGDPSAVPRSAPAPASTTRPMNSCPSEVGPTWPLPGCGPEGHHHRALGVLRGVGAAQAVVDDLDDDFAARGLGLGAVLDAEVVRAVQDGSAHEWLLVRVRRTR